MTDRIRTLKVLLDRDYRADDAEPIRNALRMVRGVQRVEDGEAVGIDEHLARNAALHDFAAALFDFLHLATSRNAEGADLLREVQRLLAEYRRRRGGP